MSEQRFTRITISTTGSYYSEQETAEYCRLEVQVLRQLSESGIIPGMQVVGEEVRYSDEDLVLLRRARRLNEDLVGNREASKFTRRRLVRLEAFHRKPNTARKEDDRKR